MSDILELMIYPVKKLVLLLFSLSYDGISIAAFMISASALAIVFRFLIGRLVGGYLIDASGVRRLSYRMSKKSADADPRLKEK